MKCLFRIALVVGLAHGMAGCTILSPEPPGAAMASAPPKIIAAGRAMEAVVAGTSTRTDVAAALGETFVIRFDSGYEVWVYRVASSPAGKEPQEKEVGRAGSAPARRGSTGEFVVLFAPSGVVAKTRVRPAPQRAGTLAEE